MLHRSYPIRCALTVPRDNTVNGLHAAWRGMKDQLQRRLDEFSALWNEGSEESIFAELVFCLLTPQSKALNCWAAVETLFHEGMLLTGSAARISRKLAGVRFHHTKAARIVMARRQFTSSNGLEIRSKIAGFGSIYDARDWLVGNVDGFGYKEASHFLRNIGFYAEICILDRHILRNLKSFGVIDKIPDTLPRNRYLAIEQKMKDFARRVNIPASQFDLLLWCRETGGIFK